MMTIPTALAALDTQRDNLAANLTTKGVAAANTETLAQLVPKVLNITSGGGGFTYGFEIQAFTQIELTDIDKPA